MLRDGTGIELKIAVYKASALIFVLSLAFKAILLIIQRILSILGGYEKIGYMVSHTSYK